jgi:hypothetical protein
MRREKTVIGYEETVIWPGQSRRPEREREAVPTNDIPQHAHVR